MRRLRLLIVPLLLGVMGLVAGFYGPRADDLFALRKHFEIFGAVYEELAGTYVDPLDPGRLMRTGIDAMLADLDPYTTFIDEADHAAVEIITQGQYGGIGLNMAIRGGRVTVTSPIEGASGYKQGVRAGDVVTHIAGQPADGFTLSDVYALTHGEPGTTVSLTIERAGVTGPLEFVLTRERVRVKNVSYAGFVADDTAAGIGYVRLDRFARNAATEVRQAVQTLGEQGMLRGLVLDLRDNPGGLLDEAVTVTSLFVPQGEVVVTTRGRDAARAQAYRTQEPPLAPDVPLVVLVNELSASAAEIVAGAVQDLDRGVVVGERTLGKGLVQVVKPLRYNTSLKVTTARYYTPSGRSIQAIDYRRHDGVGRAIPDSLRRAFRTRGGRVVRDGGGVEPDLVVGRAAPSDLEAALERRAAFFFFANRYAAGRTSLPAGFEVDETLLGEFEAWLTSEDFSYRTAAERAVEALEAALAEADYTGAEDEVASVRAALTSEKEADFARHADRFRERLRAEIAARFLDERAQVAAGLAHDVQLLEAARVLRNRDAYEALLP